MVQLITGTGYPTVPFQKGRGVKIPIGSFRPGIAPTTKPPVGPSVITPAIKPTTRPKTVALRDWMQQYVINSMLDYLDPITRYETQQWLARDNPETYKAYQRIPPVLNPSASNQPTNVKDFLTPDKISKMSEKLRWENIVGSMPKQIRIDVGNRKSTANDLSAGLNWMREALDTAKGATQGSSRTQQNFAKGHLATLQREAQMEPDKVGKFSTLFENLVNPILTRARPSGLFGQARSLSKPGGNFRRKGVKRNISFT